MVDFLSMGSIILYNTSLLINNISWPLSHHFTNRKTRLAPLDGLLMLAMDKNRSPPLPGGGTSQAAQQTPATIRIFNMVVNACNFHRFISSVSEAKQMDKKHSSNCVWNLPLLLENKQWQNVVLPLDIQNMVSETDRPYLGNVLFEVITVAEEVARLK